MIRFSYKKLALGVSASMVCGYALAAFAQTAPANLLDTLDRGMWQFRAIGGGRTGATIDRLCVGNTAKLAQIEHAASDCKQLVLRASANSVTISYSCRGEGQGTTTIRKESSKLIHIDSQGIKGSGPFAFNVEARMVGSCAGATR